MDVLSAAFPITVTVARDGGGTAVFRLPRANLNRLLRYIALCGGQLQNLESAEGRRP